MLPRGPDILGRPGPAVGAALLGPVLFAETLTQAEAGWLAVIIAGVVWLKLADRPVPAHR